MKKIMTKKQFEEFLDEKLSKTRVQTVHGHRFITKNFEAIDKDKLTTFQIGIYPWQEITVKGNDIIGYEVLIVG